MKIIAIITDPLSVNSILRYTFGNASTSSAHRLSTSLEKKGLLPFDLPKADSPPGRLALID
jgi:hypothetical protein